MAKFKKFPPMRAAFVGLDKPMAYKDKNGKESTPKFSVTCLIPKKDKATYKDVLDFITASIGENGAWKAEKKKQILNRSLKTVTDEGVNNNCVIRDGDELNRQRVIDDKAPYEFFKDSWVIKFSRRADWAPAMVVDRKAQEIPGAMIPTLIRPGFWVIIEASAYVYDGANAGISLQLQGVQLYKKDAEFGRSNNFEAVPGADDDDDDVTTANAETFED